jgi:hypothetical protein
VTPDSDGAEIQTAHQRLSQRLAKLREKRYKGEEALEKKQQEEDLEAHTPEQPVEAVEPVPELSIVPVPEQSQKNPVADNDPITARSQRSQTSTKSQALTVTQFKALWSSLESRGQFQCKLREDPNMHILVEHMRKQGFSIVFASTNTQSSQQSVEEQKTGESSSVPTVDIELGITNIPKQRASSTSVPQEGEGGQPTQEAQEPEPWFLARFIVSKRIFSAVMKCHDPDIVRMYVKKFSLAKTLKIDTSSMQ